MLQTSFSKLRQSFMRNFAKVIQLPVAELVPVITFFYSVIYLNNIVYSKYNAALPMNMHYLFFLGMIVLFLVLAVDKFIYSRFLWGGVTGSLWVFLLLFWWQNFPQDILWGWWLVVVLFSTYISSSHRSRFLERSGRWMITLFFCFLFIQHLFSEDFMMGWVMLSKFLFSIDSWFIQYFFSDFFSTVVSVNYNRYLELVSTRVPQDIVLGSSLLWGASVIVSWGIVCYQGIVAIAFLMPKKIIGSQYKHYLLLGFFIFNFFNSINFGLLSLLIICGFTQINSKDLRMRSIYLMVMVLFLVVVYPAFNYF